MPLHGATACRQLPCQHTQQGGFSSTVVTDHSDALPASDLELQWSAAPMQLEIRRDRKSTRLNSSHSQISYAVFCLKKKKKPSNTGEVYRVPSCPDVACSDHS